MCLVCNAVLRVFSRLAIILMRYMVALLYMSSLCLLTGSVLWLFIVVKWVVVRPTGVYLLDCFAPVFSCMYC